MKTDSRVFKFFDLLCLAVCVLPIVACIVIKILTEPMADGINIEGATVYFTLKTPLGALPITETQVNSAFAVVSILGLCLYFTRGLKTKPTLKRQYFAEWIVNKAEKFVVDNTDGYFKEFVPFVVAVMSLSAVSSLMSLFGLFPPTADINTVAGWSIAVFFLITFYKMKSGVRHYLKSFTKPAPFLLPLNILNEFATPVSMSFRHYGNILSGTVISVLISFALRSLSKMVFGIFGERFPIFQIGIPAVLSLYFDVFSTVLQAYIFAVLTMLYVSGGLPPSFKIGGNKND